MFLWWAPVETLERGKGQRQAKAKHQQRPALAPADFFGEKVVC